jgi:hypothetical protein
VSRDVATANVEPRYDAAAGLVIPAIDSVAAVLAASAHPVPKVMVTVEPVVTAVAFGVAVQPVNPTPSVITGFKGMANAELNTTVMVLPATRAPPALDVKPMVQVVFVAPATIEDPEKVTAETLKAVMTTGDAGDPAVVSLVVETANVEAAYEPAAGLVIPAIVSVAAVLLASAHPLPSVMATVEPVVVAVAFGVEVQPVNPTPSVITGCKGIPNAELNTTVMRSPASRAPLALEVKPTVQVVFVAPATIDDPAKLTPAIPAMTTGDAGDAAVSCVVETANVAAGYDPEAGLVIPAIVSVAVVLLASAHPVPRVMLTDEPVVVAVATGVAVQPVNATPSVITGCKGMMNAELNAAVMVLPAIRAPLPLDLKPTVQVVFVAPGSIEDPAKVTADTVAPAGRASKVAPKPPASNPSTRATGKNRLNRGESPCR